MFILHIDWKYENNALQGILPCETNAVGLLHFKDFQYS